MNLKPSDRIENIEESSTLAMSAKASEMKSKGIDVISLSLGEPDFKTPSHICDGAKKAIDSGNYFSYPPVNGYLDLREAISKKFSNENNLDYHPNNIIVSNGVKQSITNVMFSLLNKGDEVIVFSPYWVSYDAIIKLADGIPIHLNGNIENDFKPSANDLEKSVSSKTKLIIFSSPCTPTGSVFTKDELMPKYARLIYNGYWFAPERVMMQKAIDATQKRVNGHVKLVLYKGNVIVIGRQSPNSLYDEDLATFESSNYDQRDAEGFIKLNALRLRKNKLKF